MKNPLVKNDDTGLVIVAVAVGAILAGAISYLYATKNGLNFQKKVANVAEDTKEHANDYLDRKNHHIKKKKTGLHEIEEIVKG